MLRAPYRLSITFLFSFVKESAGAVHVTLSARPPWLCGVKVTDHRAARTARGNLRPVVTASESSTENHRAGGFLVRRGPGEAGVTVPMNG